MCNEAVERAAAVISRFPQVVPYYFVIIGNPYEREDDLVATVRHLARLPGRFFLQAFNLVFFPGSLLYERAVSDGLIEGKQGSGYELDVRAGFRYAGHAWKERNLYLNGLLFLMEGKGTRARLGCIPRRLLSGLVSPRWIRFHDRHPGLIKVTIAARLRVLRLRTRTARALKRVLPDPTAVYNLPRYLGRQFGWSK